MGYRKSMLPGFAKYSKKESPFRKEKKFEGSKRDTGGIKKNLKPNKFKVEFDAKMKAYDDLPLWKKVFKTPPNVIGGVAPLPGLSKGLMAKMLKQFNKGAGAAKKQSNIIQKSLEKKGYTFKKNKSPLKEIDSRKGPEHVAKMQAIDKKQHKAMKRASRGQK